MKERAVVKQEAGREGAKKEKKGGWGWAGAGRLPLRGKQRQSVFSAPPLFGPSLSLLCLFSCTINVFPISHHLILSLSSLFSLSLSSLPSSLPPFCSYLQSVIDVAILCTFSDVSFWHFDLCFSGTFLFLHAALCMRLQTLARFAFCICTFCHLGIWLLYRDLLCGFLYFLSFYFYLLVVKHLHFAVLPRHIFTPFILLLYLLWTTYHLCIPFLTTCHITTYIYHTFLSRYRVLPPAHTYVLFLFYCHTGLVPHSAAAR